MRRDDIRRLHEQRAKVLAEMRSLNDKAESEDRDLTAEETAEFDRMEKEYGELEVRARRAEKVFIEEREVDKSLTMPIEHRVDDGDAPTTYAEYRKATRGPKPWDMPEVRSAYFKYMSVRSISELDVEEQRALSKASGAVGAFLVPTSFYDEIIRATRWLGSFGSLATTITTDSGEAIQVPANTVHGTAAWIGEGGNFTPADETFAQVTLNAYKAGTSILVSEELLTDSAFELDTFLATEFGERIGVLEETAYISGDGTGKPQGILDTSAAITVITAPSGNATKFSYDALMDLLYGVPMQYRAGGAWLMADGEAKNLRLLRDNNGNPLWATNVAAGDPDTFCGYPVSSHPDMPAPAASAKSIAFGNWKRVYLIRRVDGFSLQRQGELYSNSGQVGWRGYTRVDGRVVLAAAARIMAHSAT